MTRAARVRTGLLTMLAISGSASAQPADVTAGGEVIAAVPAPAAIGYGALPGGLHVPSASTLPAGAVEVAVLGGYGYRKGLLSADHTFNRGIGDLAVAFGATDMISIGVSLDGRYDKHFHLAPSGDDGYVGDPHLFVRVARPQGKMTLGGQVGVWVPGKDAPSVVGKAISFDLRGLLTLAAGPGALSITAGFRIDNSLKSVDRPTELSAQDRVSLGVSDYHAVLGGVNYTITSGKLWVGGEVSTDVFVGSGAPGPLVRGGASVGFHLNDQFSVLGFVEGAKVPGLSYGAVAANMVTLIPYEPIVTGGIGFQGRFGGPSRTRGSVVKNDVPNKVEVIEYADLAGEVSDDNGKPVVGAMVTVKLKNHTGSAVTDGKGAWKVSQLPIGKTIDGVTTLDDTGAEVTVAVDNKKPGKSTLTLAKGANSVAKIALESMLPPGQLRALVKSLVSGKAIAGATAKIEPGGKTATSDAEGKFSVDLAPGQYKITVTAPNLAEQQLDVTIDPNGVAIKNIDLHK